MAALPNAVVAERRAQRRVPIQMPVEFRPVASGVAYSRGESRDASGEAMYVETAELPLPGTVLDMTFIITPNERLPICATVVRVDRERHGMVVRFTEK
jgi:hypothetical protein